MNLIKIKLNSSCIYCKKELFTSQQGRNSHLRGCKPYRDINSMGPVPDTFGDKRYSSKGLTKETSEYIRTQIASFKINLKSGKTIASFTNRKHSEESKLKISRKLSVNARGGKCKWYDFEGQKLQGTWELNIAKKLSEANIKWNKIKLYNDSFPYIIDGKERTYTPDLYIEEIDSYLEIKRKMVG